MSASRAPNWIWRLGGAKRILRRRGGSRTRRRRWGGAWRRRARPRTRCGAARRRRPPRGRPRAPPLRPACVLGGVCVCVWKARKSQCWTQAETQTSRSWTGCSSPVLRLGIYCTFCEYAPGNAVICRNGVMHGTVPGCQPSCKVVWLCPASTYRIYIHTVFVVVLMIVLWFHLVWIFIKFILFINPIFLLR